MLALPRRHQADDLRDAGAPLGAADGAVVPLHALVRWPEMLRVTIAPPGRAHQVDKRPAHAALSEGIAEFDRLADRGELVEHRGARKPPRSRCAHRYAVNARALPLPTQPCFMEATEGGALVRGFNVSFAARASPRASIDWRSLRCVDGDPDAEAWIYQLRAAGCSPLASVEHSTRHRLATVRLLA